MCAITCDIHLGWRSDDCDVTMDQHRVTFGWLPMTFDDYGWTLGALGWLGVNLVWCWVALEPIMLTNVDFGCPSCNVCSTRLEHLSLIHFVFMLVTCRYASTTDGKMPLRMSRMATMCAWHAACNGKVPMINNVMLAGNGKVLMICIDNWIWKQLVEEQLCWEQLGLIKTCSLRACGSCGFVSN